MNLTALIAILVTAAISFQTADETLSLGRYESGTKVEQDRWINGFFSSTVRPETPADLAGIIAVRLKDELPKARAQALALYAARIGARRFSNEFNVLSRAAGELGALTQIRPLIVAALKDSSPDVRDAAVMALGNFDAATGDGLHVELQPQTIRLLLSVLEVESDANVRATIIQGFALGRNNSPQIAAVLASRASDSSPEVRLLAMRGVHKLPPLMALKLLQQGLRDSDSKVRFTAAQMAPKLGRIATSLIQDVESAEQREGDPTMAEGFRRISAVLRALRDQQ